LPDEGHAQCGGEVSPHPVPLDPEKLGRTALSASLWIDAVSYGVPMDEIDVPHSDTPYTHGHSDAVLRSHRWRTAQNSAAYLIPHLKPAMHLLDVGCGPGTLSIDLARHVAPGRVLGVDLDPSVVAEAVQTAEGSGLDISFVVGDFAKIDAPAEGFDVVHAHQVLQHVGDPVSALRSMAQLARPSGIIAARDADYPAMSWYPQEPQLDQWLDMYMAVTTRNGANADGGRQLLRWAQHAGLRDIAYTTSTWTFHTGDDLAWWTSLWADRVTTSRLGEMAVNYGIATGEELDAMAQAWRAWGTRPGAVFVVMHGEIVARS
jgi:2-polyprenyl-3-methyl-5-hydroxy-6-metoxy-1,4-benzoquinol methylase